VHYISAVGYHQTLLSVDVNFVRALTAKANCFLEFLPHEALRIFSQRSGPECIKIADQFSGETPLLLEIYTYLYVNFEPAKLVSLKLNAYLNVSPRI
jgi:hypothetical protein